MEAVAEHGMILLWGTVERRPLSLDLNFVSVVCVKNKREDVRCTASCRTDTMHCLHSHMFKLGAQARNRTQMNAMS
jgi:hypothetical protein